ncbi:anthranilate/aminodeoxychorismate synthase component II [Candidatus Marinamargulisbacteria bacterium SCGC AG-439-L15]|nr:anthranilate/aminodeoxychorismate synthase component II [Candidatus Marinamargulisbacteria bacterium SCGC AG-439-L15]
MILVIDNYDSFTYNLVDYFGKISNYPIKIYRNDEINSQEIQALNPNYIIISPGPKTPTDAGISKAVISEFGETIPILGVCLGHQSIGEVYGGDTIQAKTLKHGKVSTVTHNNDPLFKDIPSTFDATRYHSLVINPQTMPSCLKVLATSDDDEEVMAVKHETHPVYGVQFHPESICTPEGLTILKNFLELH